MRRVILVLEYLKSDVQKLGKDNWRSLLKYSAELHEKDIHPADHFRYPWEEIGIGYCYGPGFGHWDLTHIILDEYESETEHAMNQILNNFEYQTETGMIPGVIYIRDGKPMFNQNSAYPPVWVFPADAIYRKTGNREFLGICLDALLKNLKWWENERHADNGGYYYMDYADNRNYESGVDEGIRFIREEQFRSDRKACVDATAHVYSLQVFAVEWGKELSRSDETIDIEYRLPRTLDAINNMFDPESGWFYDSWISHEKKLYPESLEGIWPMVCGAATSEQAKAVLVNLMDKNKFFTPHPLPSVSIDSPRFEKRMWRGPVWDSMTMWEVLGLLRYGFTNEAKIIIERVLDSVSTIFEKTGTIWEFYDPMNGTPSNVQRKPWSEYNQPCHDYLGHAPYIWMARRYDEICEQHGKNGGIYE